MTENTGARPEIAYWHLWTDGDGVSHQTRCALTEFELKGVGGAAPQWNNQQRPVRSDGRLHRAAGGLGGRLAREPGAAVDRRAVRPLVDRVHGRHAHRTGPRRVLARRGPGLHASSNGRKGHRSGTIGDAPAVLMTVQLHVPPCPQPLPLHLDGAAPLAPAPVPCLTPRLPCRVRGIAPGYCSSRSGRSRPGPELRTNRREHICRYMKPW